MVPEHRSPACPLTSTQGMLALSPQYRADATQLVVAMPPDPEAGFEPRTRSLALRWVGRTPWRFGTSGGPPVVYRLFGIQLRASIRLLGFFVVFGWLSGGGGPLKPLEVKLFAPDLRTSFFEGTMGTIVSLVQRKTNQHLGPNLPALSTMQSNPKCRTKKQWLLWTWRVFESRRLGPTPAGRDLQGLGERPPGAVKFPFVCFHVRRDGFCATLD